MTLTEKGNSTIHSIGGTPGEKVHHYHHNMDTGSNGGNVNQHKQTKAEIDSNSADQLLWRDVLSALIQMMRIYPGLCLEILMNGLEYVLFAILFVLMK
jgi:hypothetical protein